LATISRAFYCSETLGGETLSRFLAFHVFFLPAAIFAVVGIHLYLLIHDGISAPPIPGVKVNPKTYRAEYEQVLNDRGVLFWPDVAWRHVVVAFVVVVTIVSLAHFVGPPALNSPPNPSLLANDPRPDWYMLWYFAVLALLPHGLESAFMILAPLS
jgi:ubiquinol-cytochrome c reductase cytochrome b subunit